VKKKSPVKKKLAPPKRPPKKKRPLKKRPLKRLPKRPLIVKTPAPTNSTSTLTFLTEGLPDFYVGQSANFSMEAVGGTPPYSFQITQGTLPPGLNFSSSGTISGTPTQTDDTTIFVKLTDSASPQGHITEAFALRVDTSS